MTRSERYEATGSVDTTTGEVTVTAAASLFPSALTSGLTWAVVDVLARTGPMSTSLDTTDAVEAAAGDTLEVGTGCQDTP